MKPVCTFALASVVYHYEWLCEILHRENVVLYSALFQNLDRLRYLKQLVILEKKSFGNIRATGIPPHVSSLVQNELLRQTMLGLQDFVKSSNKETVTEIIRFLQEQAIGLGAVTEARLQDVLAKTVQSAFDTSKFNEIMEEIQAQKRREIESNIQTQSSAPTGWFASGARKYKHYLDFRGTLTVALQHWCCGNPSRNIPPLRKIKSKKLPRKKHRLYNNFKFMMLMVESEAKRQKLWKDNLSPAEAADILTKTRHVLKIPDKTPKGRKRRLDQLMWTTCARIVREFHPRSSQDDSSSADFEDSPSDQSDEE